MKGVVLMRAKSILSKGIGLALTAAISLSPIMSQAAPKTMPDGTIFDPEFYAATYPDVRFNIQLIFLMLQIIEAD